MKESAVDYLKFQFKALILAEDALMKENKFFQTLDTIINEAKQMEKEQIIDARINGDMNGICIAKLAKEKAEQYYSETYKVN